MIPASRIALVSEYFFSKKLRQIAEMRAAGREILNLGIGSPDGPPDRKVIKTLADAAQKADAHGYQSYQGAPFLRSAIAAFYEKKFGVRLDPAREILPLIGSKEGIMHLSMAYLEAGTKALVPNPGYPTYRACAVLAGAEAVDYELFERKKWRPDLDALAKKDLSNLRIFWANWPNMPTGARADAGFFRDLHAFGKAHNCLIINDNPYAMILNLSPQSLLAVDGALNENSNLLELNSLSKSHNMAGWRVGWLAGRAELLAPVLTFKSNMDSGQFLPMQAAAATALELGENWSRRLNAIYRKRQKLVFELLENLGCTFSKSQTGLFVWAKIPKNSWRDGFEMSDALLESAGVFITPGGVFGSAGAGFVRVSICSDEVVLRRAIEKTEPFLPKKDN